MKTLLARIFGKKTPMTNLTIIGNGNMARGIATRALAGGLTVEILGQDAAKAKELAAELGASVTFGTTADAPQGDIVVLAIPFGAAKSVVSAYGDTLAGKTIVDITNPVNFETFDSLVVEPGNSAAEEIAQLATTGANVVKAFNTTFAGTLIAGESGGQPLDVFIAGDNAEANAAVSTFVSAGGMRPPGGRSAQARPGTRRLPVRPHDHAGQPGIRRLQLGHQTSGHQVASGWQQLTLPKREDDGGKLPAVVFSRLKRSRHLTKSSYLLELDDRLDDRAVGGVFEPRVDVSQAVVAHQLVHGEPSALPQLDELGNENLPHGR